jgi:hypothetical protein
VMLEHYKTLRLVFEEYCAEDSKNPFNLTLNGFSSFVYHADFLDSVYCRQGDVDTMFIVANIEEGGGSDTERVRMAHLDETGSVLAACAYARLYEAPCSHAGAVCSLRALELNMQHQQVKYRKAISSSRHVLESQCALLVYVLSDKALGVQGC